MRPSGGYLALQHDIDSDNISYPQCINLDRLLGAVDVFLDFICYSGGPLPEELLEKTTVPVSMLWGEKVSLRDTGWL
jgi:hypothetical protein